MILSNCDAVRDALPEALAGRLAPEDARAVAAHLTGCAECQGEAELIRLLRQHPVRVPDGLEARVRAVAPARAPASRFRAARPALMAAAAAGLLLGGGLLLRSRLDERTGAAAAAPPAASTPAVSTPETAAPAPAPVDGRALMQALPGTNEAGLFSSAGSLDDLSEDELRTLLKELQS